MFILWISRLELVFKIVKIRCSKEEIRAEEISFNPDDLAKATANLASLVC